MPILKRKPKAPFSADYSKSKMIRNAKFKAEYNVALVQNLRNTKEFQGLIRRCETYLEQKKLKNTHDNLAKMILKYATPKQRERLNDYWIGKGDLPQKIKVHMGSSSKPTKESNARQRLAAKKMKQRRQKK
jgi:hypothetical protein